LKHKRAFAKAFFDKNRFEILIIGGKNSEDRCPDICEVLKLANNKVESRWKLNTPRYNFGMSEWKYKDQRRL